MTPALTLGTLSTYIGERRWRNFHPLPVYQLFSTRLGLNYTRLYSGPVVPNSAAAGARLQGGMQGGGAKGGTQGMPKGMPVVTRSIADVLAQDIHVSETKLREGLVLAMEPLLPHRHATGP